MFIGLELISAKPKIREFNLIIFGNEYIFRLDIPMRNPHHSMNLQHNKTITIIDSQHKLLEIPPALRLQQFDIGVTPFDQFVLVLTDEAILAIL